MSTPRTLLLAIGFVLVASGCAAAGSDTSGTGSLEADAGPLEADAGPPVTDRAFETFDGRETNLTAYEGQPLVVNFWASWCPPCVAEMPEFERVHLDRGDQVRFVGLNTQDELEDARALAELTGVTYELGLDPDGSLFGDFEVISLPSTYFVNAAGAVVHRHAGVLTEQQLQDLIDEHLVGDGASA